MSNPTHRKDPLPIALAVLWGPAAVAAPQPLKHPYPIFLHQKPLRQLLAHTRTSADKMLLGLLLGDVRECPESGITYVVVEQMLRVDLEVRGDNTAALMAQLWPRLQEKLKGQAAGPVGWYHSHPTGGLVLSPHDVETQSKHFTDPWQAVLLLATEGGKPIAGWFRVAADDSWKTTPLPFYEILAPESVDSTGKKRSFVDWANYKGYKALPPAAATAAARPQKAPPKDAVPTPRPRRPSGPKARPEPPRAAPPPRQAPSPTPPAAPPKAAPPPKVAQPPKAASPPKAAPQPPREPTRAPAPPPPGEPVRAQAPPPPAARIEPLEIEQSLAPSPPVEEKKPARQSLTFILPEDLDEPKPPPPRSRASHAAPTPIPARAPAPAARASTAAPRAVEAPRKSTRRLPLRHVVTASVGAAAMVAMFVGAWAAGLIHFGPSADSAATEPDVAAGPPPPAGEEAPPPARDPAPVPEEPVAPRPQSTPTQAAPPPAAATPAPVRTAPVNPALVALDQLTDSVLASVRTYRTRRTQFGQGTADCASLADALVVVEGHWINYNVQGKPRDLVLDATRAARDRSLYAEVDSVETHFDRSACPRP